MKRKTLNNSTQWSNKKIKLAILVPSRDYVSSHFTYCLAQLMKTSSETGLDVFLFMDSGTILLNQRENLINRAKEINADYVLWLDSDMIFPPTTALRLLAHNKDIVACNYMKRTKPFTTVAYTDIKDWNSWVPLKRYDDLLEVEGVGMGCMLMNAKVFELIDKPYFQFTYSESTGDWIGEDFSVLEKFRKKNISVYIDTVLSIEIKHVGIQAFGVKS